jgi:hypothetical protein
LTTVPLPDSLSRMSMPSILATKYLTAFDVITLMSLPSGRDLIGLQTDYGFDTAYGFMLYSVAGIRLYWVSGAATDAFVVVRHHLGVDVQLATASTAADAADAFNVAVQAASSATAAYDF